MADSKEDPTPDSGQTEITLPGVLSALRTTLEDLRQALAAGTASGPAWLGLKAASTYCGVSERKLRSFLGHSTHLLPAHRIAGKWVINVADLDRWLRSFPKAGQEIDCLVDELLADLNNGRRRKA